MPLNPKKIKGLVFDFDGLILDTENPQFQAWQELYCANGSHLLFEDWSRCLGASDKEFDPFENLQKVTGKKLDRISVMETHRLRAFELSSMNPVLPGVMDYLHEARKLGLGLAVASSSPSPRVRGHLDRLGMAQCFDFVLTREDVAEAKPNPDLYLKAVGLLSIPPTAAVAFEDTPNGILAAKRADLFCVAVPSDLTRSMNFNLADLVLSSLADMPLATLLNCIEEPVF